MCIHHRSLRPAGADRRRLPVPPSGSAAPHDAHHLHLPLQANPQEKRPAARAERPFSPAHRRQSDDRGQHGCRNGGGHPRPQPALHHTGYLYPRLRQEQKGRQRKTTKYVRNISYKSLQSYSCIKDITCLISNYTLSLPIRLNKFLLQCSITMVQNIYSI